MLRAVFFSGWMVIAYGQNTAPAFEVATVKPNTSGSTSMKFPFPSGGRFTATNTTIKTLIAFAYGMGTFGIEGAPGWMNSDRYDVNAKAAETGLSREQYQFMLRTLLADRFKLAVHQEMKDLPVYSLVTAKNGPKLKEADEGGCIATGPTAPPPPPRAPGQSAPIVCGAWFTGPFSLDGRKLSMTQFANALAVVLGRPVTDNTGIMGGYDIHIEFAPEGVNLGQGPPALESANLGNGPAADRANADSDRPSIFTAVQEQLGLKLESKKEPSQILVIDHVERAPTQN